MLETKAVKLFSIFFFLAVVGVVFFEALRWMSEQCEENRPKVPLVEMLVGGR
jgi:hypothetical protein